MKKLFAIALIILSPFWLARLCADCPMGNITLSSQADINSFPSTYSGCNIMEYSIIIQEAVPGDIVNLNGLSGIDEIYGTLEIRNNLALNNLSGLGSLNLIGGGLVIENNDALTSLAGLEDINEVGGLSIADNLVLTNISALTGLSSLNESLFIGFNDALTNLSGLGGITNVQTHLTISHNPVLANIDALNSITSIGDILVIEHNPLLGSIAGLNSLSSVGGAIFINNNAGLSSISGLNGISAISGDLFIYLNTDLSTIAGFGILTSISGNLSLLTNINLNDISGFNALTTIGGSLVVNQTDLADLSAFALVGSIGWELIIAFNESLTNIDGIQNINEASIGFLEIAGNPLLAVCDVQNICDYLSDSESSASIQGNAPGCADRTEVETACGLVLPVELTYFKGEQTGAFVSLHWRTTTERDNAYFEVEKSDDGWHWVGVGRVEGRGTTNEATNYDLLDNHPFPGINYYRLRQVDIDGKEEYLEVVSIDLRNLEDFGNLRLAPNPATTHLQLSNVELADFDYLQVNDQHGRQVLMTHDLASSLEIGHLEPGIYILQLKGASTTQTLRFVKN